MIPGDLDNVPKNQYYHGIFGLQVSAGSQDGAVAGQMLKYNAKEDAEKLARRLMPFKSILLKNQDWVFQ